MYRSVVRPASEAPHPSPRDSQLPRLSFLKKVVVFLQRELSTSRRSLCLAIRPACGRVGAWSVFEPALPQPGPNPTNGRPTNAFARVFFRCDSVEGIFFGQGQKWRQTRVASSLPEETKAQVDAQHRICSMKGDCLSKGFVSLAWDIKRRLCV